MKNATQQLLFFFVVMPTLSLLALNACEGEPPVVTPENTLAMPRAPSTIDAATLTSPEPPAEAPIATACPPPPCAAPGDAGTAVVLESSATASLSVPPASVPRGNIVGTVTTKPASLQGEVVVYLEDGPTEDQPSHLQTITIANRQMTFAPFVSVVGAGGKVVFANEDPFPHNVFSPDNDKFNMGNIPQNGAHFRVFKSPGVYSLLCNLHPGMLGYLLVTPSPWYARTDAKGNFVMKHVPTGSYKATAWAPRDAPVTLSVTVTEGDVTAHFDLHR